MHNAQWNHAQLPVVYTNRDGDKLVKVADKFYKAGDVTNGIPNQGVTPVNSGCDCRYE